MINSSTTTIRELIKEKYSENQPACQGFYDVEPSDMQLAIERAKQTLQQRMHGIASSSNHEEGCDTGREYPTGKDVDDAIIEVAKSLDFDVLFLVMGREILDLCYPALRSACNKMAMNLGQEGSDSVAVSAEASSAIDVTIPDAEIWYQRFECEIDSSKRRKYLDGLEPMELIAGYGRQLIALHNCQICLMHPEGEETLKEEWRLGSMLREICGALELKLFRRSGAFSKMRSSAAFLDAWYEPLQRKMKREIAMWDDKDYEGLVRCGLWYGSVPLTNDWQLDWDGYEAASSTQDQADVQGESDDL